eukprot:sb/3473581/
MRGVEFGRFAIYLEPRKWLREWRYSLNPPPPFPLTQQIVSVFLFIAGFASGLGSLPWLMVNELFTTEYRGLANSICCSVNWISSIILLLTYSLVKEALHPFTFFLYMGVVLFFLAFVILFVPETRQKTVQEIKAELTVQAKRFPPLVQK